MTNKRNPLLITSEYNERVTNVLPRQHQVLGSREEHPGKYHRTGKEEEQ